MKQILLSLILVFALISCGTTMNLGTKVRNVEIGMTKQELIATLGKNFNVKGAARTPDGVMETLTFQDALYPQTYVFNLLNGKLVEWFEEVPTPVTVVNEHNHRNR